MRDRAGQILKLACLVLAVILAVQLAQFARRMKPLSGVVVPALPALAADTNSSPATVKGTNKPGGSTGTNVLAIKSTNNPGSNSVAAAQVPKTATNSATGETNAANSTNAAAPAPASPPDEVAVAKTKVEAVEVAAIKGATNPVAGTNGNLPLAFTGTNDSNAFAGMGTNGRIAVKSGRRGTNANRVSAMMRMGMGPNMGGMALPELPPETKARIDRIYESELLGQVIRPQPMGLIGIAGDVAFLRSDNGQTGMVKEGETVGDLKLLQIGVNRVLVEQAGQKKELTIFDGYGGKSLLPPEKEKENPK
jgi:hypothetical protein